MKVLVLNLMPHKQATEHQIKALATGMAQPPAFTFMYPASHRFKNPAIMPYLQAHYVTFDQIVAQQFDGLIVTGTPVETLPFPQVDYWAELSRLLDWAATHVAKSLYLCWGAQAALQHDYHLEKQLVPAKIFGVFQHEPRQAAPLFKGLTTPFYMPHSRHTTLRTADVLATPGLKLLVDDSVAGPVIMQSQNGRRTYISGHPEYATQTLAQEYQRDRQAGLTIALPQHYFQANDPKQPVINRWQVASRQLFRNWLLAK